LVLVPRGRLRGAFVAGSARGWYAAGDGCKTLHCLSMLRHLAGDGWDGASLDRKTAADGVWYALL